MAYPEPTEVAPWYLRNITQALELNSTTGQVFVRTGLTEGANITLTGNVTIPGEVDNHITNGLVSVAAFAQFGVVGSLHLCPDFEQPWMMMIQRNSLH